MFEFDYLAPGRWITGLYRGLIVSGTQSRSRAHITFYVNSGAMFSPTVLMASHSCEAIPVTVR